MRTVVTTVVLSAALAVAGCGPASGLAAHAKKGQILAVGAESEYSDVISQVGGRYVSTTAVMDKPSTDPHTFESSPSVAQAVGSAELVVQNGLGYDDFMQKIEQATSKPKRETIDVQHVLNLPGSIPNPHLWYQPSTMPAVADAIAGDLSAIQPAHAAYFRQNVARFTQSLVAWNQALGTLRSAFPNAPVATTEPVADYLLQAAGLNILTPWAFQADVMNGVDPSPQDTTFVKGLLTGHKVKAFVYNQQVTDSLTKSMLALAQQNHIPVVGVYETMPTPGYNYQKWMQAEVQALHKALANATSTTKL